MLPVGQPETSQIRFLFNLPGFLPDPHPALLHVQLPTCSKNKLEKVYAKKIANCTGNP